MSGGISDFNDTFSSDLVQPYWGVIVEEFGGDPRTPGFVELGHELKWQQLRDIGVAARASGSREVRGGCLPTLQEDPRVFSPKASIPGVFVGLLSAEISCAVRKLAIRVDVAAGTSAGWGLDVPSPRVP